MGPTEERRNPEIRGRPAVTCEELAAGALRRGYHVLAFDGPGQGSAVRDQGLHFRPDWEAVVSPVVDYAVDLAQVDENQIILIGTSFGGFLAARAAAFEHRLAAVVLHDGIYDFHRAAAGLGLLEGEQKTDPQTRWAVRNGFWTFGVNTVEALEIAMRPYTLAGVAERITSPTLVLDAENDQFMKGQPQEVYDALTGPKKLISFPESEGGGEHCHEGAVALWHQRVFDWLDTLVNR